MTKVIGWLSAGAYAGGDARYVDTLRGPMTRLLASRNESLQELGVRGRYVTAATRRSWAYLGGPTLFLRLGRLDVVHCLDDISVPSVRGAPLVVTCHDASALRRPELVSARLAALKRASYRRALRWSRVLVPSEATATDLEGIVERERIRIVRLAVADHWRDEPEEALRVLARKRSDGHPYVVCIGPVSAKKGSDVLDAAWRQVHARHPDARLVWATGGRMSELPEIGQGSGIVQLGHVRDAELVALVAEAQLVVVPSRVEGFSYPILEAAAVGTPVVASDIHAHREFTLDGLELVPTGDPGALADAVAAALDRSVDRRPQRHLRSMADVARDTAAVYDEVFG